jgi:hypothetical protein
VEKLCCLLYSFSGFGPRHFVRNLATQYGRHAAIHPLKYRRLIPTHRPYRGGIHLGLPPMRSKGAQDGNQLVRERLQAQVRVPKAQIQRICHLY